MIKEVPILIKNLIRDKCVATIAPSSRFVVRRICNSIDFRGDITLVEYGPGTGVITSALLQKMSSNSELIAIEKNKGLFNYLNKIKDHRLSIINGDVMKVDTLLQKNLKRDKADYIVSGIPFSLCKKEERENLVGKTYALLSKDGRFILYQTSTAMKQHLIPQFAKIKTSFELINLPPMFILEASK